MNDRKMGNIGTMSQSNPVTAHGIFNNSDYKVYGKYKVKSTYSGTDSITDLMMDYASRVASLKY